MHLLSSPRRPSRAQEWTPGRAVTFIVTLAASRSVTLAARQSGMSRKAAYALKARDPLFAASWAAAVNACAKAPREGDELHEVHGPPVSSSQGDTGSALRGSARACVAAPSRIDRERTFSSLLALLRDSPPLADPPPAQ